MPRIKNNRPVAGAAGFTLVELMVAATTMMFVFAGVLSACTFFGRNLARMVNTQQLEVGSRRTFYLISKDASVASQINTAASNQLVLTLPSGTSAILPDGSTQTLASNTTVTYTYTASANGGTLTRTVGSASPSTILSNLSNLSFGYYSSNGSAISNITGIRAVDITFSSRMGTATAATQVSYAGVSPRTFLRNSASVSKLP